MLGAETDGFAQFVAPLRLGLLRAGIDQVERDARESLLRQGQRRHRFRLVVQAAQFFQIGIVQRLDAQRGAIDSGGAVIGEAGGVGAGRIGFQRDLGIIGHRPQIGYFRQHATRRCAAHQRRRAAAEENGFDHRAFYLLLRRPFQFAFDARDPGFFIHHGAYMAIEVAIGTLGGAKRKMDVDAEAHGARPGKVFLRFSVRPRDKIIRDSR